MKKIIKISIVILVIILIGFLGYFGWRWLTKRAQVEDISVTDVLPLAKTGGGAQAQETRTGVALIQNRKALSVISDTPVFSFWTVADTKSVYYISPDGRVLKTEDGEDQVISSQGLDNILSVDAVNGGSRILASFGDRASPQWAVFDVIDGVWRPLPQEILQAIWGKDNNEIIALRQNGNDTNLASLNLEKNPISVSVILKNFNFKDVALTWRPPNYLVMAEKSSSNYSGRVWQLDLKKLTLETIFQAAEGQTIKWSDDRRSAARFVAPDNFSLLGVNLQEISPLFFSTLPEKCALGAIRAYCFVPKSTPEGIVLPDDYIENRFRGDDVLYEINLVSEDVSVVFGGGDDNSSIDGLAPVYMDGSVYFINRLDGMLYRLSLN